MTVSCLMNSSLLAHNELYAVSNEYRNNLLRVPVAGQNSNPIKSTFPHVNQNIDS